MNLLKIINKKIINNDSMFFEIVKNKKKAYISYINPYNYFFYRGNIEILNSVDYLYVDGIFASILFSIILNKRIKRLSFDLNFLADTFFKFCLKNNKSIFITGAKTEELNSFITKIKKMYDGINIVGFHNGYDSIEEIINNWYKCNKSDFIIAGLGNIKQETFIKKLYELNKDVVVITCGAFITQTALAKKNYYYPKWIYKFNLMWLYRIFKEKNVLKRVCFYYPLFLLFIIYDFLIYKLSRD